MGEAQRLLNIDGIASSLKLKFDGTPVGEVLLLQLKIEKHRAAEKIGYKLGLMLQFPHE